MKSIWGNRWEPIRKWFYPVWLAYETTIRFYDYGLAVHCYIQEHQGFIMRLLGKMSVAVVDVICSGGTFIVCSVFLTLPACYILFNFFKKENLTGSDLETKLKVIF